MENKVSGKAPFAVELTFRQKAFLGKLLDVYREMQEPVHYSVIAERLGLSPSTAYDMLKLLEQKGIVCSQYATPKAATGPGRSNILFSPTAKATVLFSRLAGESNEQEGWEDVKAHILASLRQGKASEYNDLLRELLARMPEAKSSLVHCAEVITALLLSLRETRHTFGRRSPVRILLDARAGKLGMNILAGLALGLCLADQRVQQRLGNYQEYAEKYQASLEELSRDSLVKLHRFTREVWHILKAPAR